MKYRYAKAQEDQQIQPICQTWKLQIGRAMLCIHINEHKINHILGDPPDTQLCSRSIGARPTTGAGIGWRLTYSNSGISLSPHHLTNTQNLTLTGNGGLSIMLKNKYNVRKSVFHSPHKKKHIILQIKIIQELNYTRTYSLHSVIKVILATKLVDIL
jgi:hypothetical protein